MAESSHTDISALVKERVKCFVCSRRFEDPRLLSCRHTFCRACFRSHVIKDIFTCPECRAVLNLTADGLERLPSSPIISLLLEVINAHERISLAIRERGRNLRYRTQAMVTPSRTDSNGGVIMVTDSMTWRSARVEVNGNCLVCSRRFLDPRLLSCHTFCKACLRCFVKNSNVKCPYCRTVYNLTADGLEGLPSSPTIILLLEVVNAQERISLAIREPYARNKNLHHRTPDIAMVTPSRTASDERHGAIAMVTPSMPGYDERHGAIAMVTPPRPPRTASDDRHGDIVMVTPSVPGYAERHGAIAMVTPPRPPRTASDERHGAIAMVTPSMSGYAERRGTVFSDVFLGGRPWCIAVSPAADRLYVTDYGHHSVLIFDDGGRLIKTASGPGRSLMGPKSGLKQPTGIAVNKDGDVIVSDAGNHRVVILDRDGQYKSMFGTHGENDGQFDYPYGVAVDDACSIYVCDDLRVQVFTRDGEYLRTFDKPVNVSGEFRPLYLSIARTTGRVYVTAHVNHRVYVFTPLGRYITCFGTKGHGEGEMYRPRGICVDDDGRVIIADSVGNHRVQVYNGDGTYHCTLVTAPDTPQLYSPRGLTIDKNGRVFVVDTGNMRVLVF